MDDEHGSQPPAEPLPPQPPPPPASAPPPASPPPAPPGYGQPHQGPPPAAPPGYAQPPPPPGYGAAPGYGAPGSGYEQRSEGSAVAALVVSIVALFVCGLIMGPVALVLASQAQKKIDESGGRLTGSGMVKAARIIAVIAIVISVGGILFVVTS